MKKTLFALFASIAFAAALPAFAQEQQPRTMRPQPNRLIRPRPNPNVASPAGQPGAAAPAAAPAVSPGEVPALNWDGAPVDIVLQTYGEQVNKTILKDPALPTATISLKSREGQKLTKEEYLEAIEIILEMNGVHLEPYGEKFIRALPSKDVRKKGIPLIMEPKTLEDKGRVVSMMIPFKNIATDEAQKALEGLKSNEGILLVFERTNSILVTDTEQNINRMLEVAKAIDIATPVLENVFVRQVKYANATEIKTALEQIVQESQKELEKSGKQVNQAAQQREQPRPMIGGGLLRRPGQNNQQQQQAPVNNASLIMNVSDADRGMIRGKVLIIADERSNKLVIITSKSNMDFFDKVIEQLDVETTPDTVVKVYRLKYADAEDVSDMINDLIGNTSSGKSGGKENQNAAAKKGSGGNLTRNNSQPAAAKKSSNQRSGEAKAGELSKDNTTVLADKRINGLVVMTEKELVPTIEQIIESMDIKLAQVLIETVIIEVGLGHGIESGIDWVQKGRQKTALPMTDSLGRQLFYPRTKNSDGAYTDYVDYDGTPVLAGEEGASEVPATAIGVARDGILNYFSGGAYGMAGGAEGGQAAYALGKGLATNLLSKSFSFVFDSDELGLAAILHAAESDSHSKYIASPIIMTLDNKEATVNATAMHYLLKGFTSSGNSYSTIAVPDYEQKELGIEIKTTPKINPNGTVMLTVEEKYTQLGSKETIQYSSSNSADGSGGLQSVQVPTTVTREMSSDVLLENGQTVVFGGLTETTTSESETGIPILKDIPWIGKWLFSSVESSESRTELLVFMTPYVLDDAQAAQVEALRRKKTLSDPRPWDDHGWSASKLADPVSRKEQMRRLKDEWKKQDQERKTKLAIEKAKIDRVKELEAMSEAERKVWLEMHKEELEKEQQEELEEKMLDKESQEELKKLAAQIRKDKLAAAEKELKANEELTRSENERARLDREKEEAKKGAKEEAKKAEKPE